MPRISLPSAAALLVSGLLTVVPALSAPLEISYPSPSAVGAVNAVSPDKRHVVAMLKETSPGSVSCLVVSRQIADGANDSWAEIFTIPLDPLPGYHVRLKSGKTTTWVAWQGIPAAGVPAPIHLRQLFPEIGPIETVGGSENQSPGFDLAIDDQERPCLGSFKTSIQTPPELIPTVNLHRRTGAGQWEHIVTAIYDGEEIVRRPEAVAIAVHGTTIHLFDIGWTEITLGSRLRVSNLYHTEIEAPAALSDARLIGYDVSSASTSASDGFQPAITDLSAAVDLDGIPAIAFTLPAHRQVRYSDATSGNPTLPWSTETLLQPGGSISGVFTGSTSLAFDRNNRPQVVWQSTTTGNIARSIRTGSTWSLAVIDSLQLSRPSFLIDSEGNFHYTGIEATAPGRAVAARPLDITDIDGNGFTHLEEAAFLMTYADDPRSRVPQISEITIGEKRYPVLSYYRHILEPSSPANPFHHPDFIYTVETSTDLESWTSASSDLVHLEDLTIQDEYTYSSWRSAKSLDESPRQFFRMRLNRAGE